MMNVHQSNVNYRNLIADLADMYPYSIEEVVPVELVANALDAGATRIHLCYDERARVLTVEDDGRGMDARTFQEYHDFAAGLKARGTGIGFAGLGAKISFNVADRVITQTRSRSFAGGSEWRLAEQGRLVWEELPPGGLSNCGTRVEVHFGANSAPSYSSEDHLANLVRTHYLPLFDTKFLDLYHKLRRYSNKLRFFVNSQEVHPVHLSEALALDHVSEFFPTRGGKRYGYGILGVSGSDYPLGPGVSGVQVCTHGKVVKSDLFDQFPGPIGPRVFGLVEVPELITFLTTAKTDFNRRGRCREFEQLYDPIRQHFKAWLRQIGVQQEEPAGADESAKLEREISRILGAVPELADFFGSRTRTNVLLHSREGTAATSGVGSQLTLPIGSGAGRGREGPEDEGQGPEGRALGQTETGGDTARPISRTSRRGPKITFVDAPQRLELAWVEGNNIAINAGHPAYIRSRSDAGERRLHCLFAIAGAVQRFLGTEGAAGDPTFVDRMMAAWGKK
ncbi:MAG: ATP-binding protein [Armatimonadetes bacterium]|nr:ATP-binding protein [Armatimonadota bacterium]